MAWCRRANADADLCRHMPQCVKCGGDLTRCNIKVPSALSGALKTWWRHQMETFYALLAICVGNSPVPREFPAQRPVTRSFDLFFDLHPNKQLSKQWWGWWFEVPSCPLWRHRNDLRMFPVLSQDHNCAYSCILYIYNCTNICVSNSWYHGTKAVWDGMKMPSSLTIICYVQKLNDYEKYFWVIM